MGRKPGSKNKVHKLITCGHLDRPHASNGNCASCHAIAWRLKNPERFKEITYRNKLRRRYDITPEQYDEILKKQNGVCALCGDPPGKKRLGVDHSHITFKIRGLLCDPCNRKMLGRIEHKNISLLKIAEYLYGGKEYGG